MIEVKPNVKEEINDCYLYIFNKGTITEYVGTIRVYKGEFKKDFVIKDSGKVVKVSPVNGVVYSRRIWTRDRETSEEVIKLFKQYFEYENFKLQWRINKNNKILKEGFVCQMAT